MVLYWGVGSGLPCVLSVLDCGTASVLHTHTRHTPFAHLLCLLSHMLDMKGALSDSLLLVLAFAQQGTLCTPASRPLRLGTNDKVEIRGLETDIRLSCGPVSRV